MAPPSAHQRTRPVHSALSVKDLAVETGALTKDYGNGRGIFDLDLRVAVGEVFGFLGPNGAGKTTTIRLLMGLIHATRGSARIFGLDCDRDSVAVKRKVGYCPGELPQFGGWRGSEIVAYVAGLRGDVETPRSWRSRSGSTSISGASTASTHTATSRSSRSFSRSCTSPRS